MNLQYLVKSKKDLANIYLRMYHKKTIDISRPTEIFVNPKQWDKKNQKIRNLIDIKDRHEVNSKLLELKSAIINRYNRDFMNGIIINGPWLENNIKTFLKRPTGEDADKDQNKTLYYTDYANWWIKNIAPTRRVSANRIMSKATIGHYRRAIKLFSEFENNQKILFTEITKKILNDFSLFLSEDKKFAKKTTQRMIIRVKFFCERAEEDNIDVNKNYQSEVFVSDETHEYEEPYLNLEEIDTIFNLDLSHDDILDNVRDNLIIGLWTGMRISDFLKSLNINNLKNGYIEITTQKTNTSVTIPIHPQVQKTLNKRMGLLPLKVSEPTFNKKIKVICEMCEINQTMLGGITKVDPVTKIKRKKIGNYKKYQLVSSHICRRSFATNTIGVIPNQDIIKIAGWSDEKMLNKYNKTTDKESANKLMEAWKQKA